MFEGNNNPEVTPSFEELTIEGLKVYAGQLEDKVKELEGELAGVRKTLELEMSWHSSLKDRFTRIAKELTEYWEQEDFSNETAFGQYLIEEFDLVITEEVEITYRASWSRTVTIPKGFDLDELELDRELPDDLRITINGEVHYLGQDRAEFEY